MESKQSPSKMTESDLQALFDKIVSVGNDSSVIASAPSLSNLEKLKFYALFKQITEGAFKG